MRPGGQVRFLETHGNSVRLGRSVCSAVITQRVPAIILGAKRDVKKEARKEALKRYANSNFLI